MRNSGEPRPCPCHLRERSCDRKRQERGVLAARVAESADSQILNRNRGDKRLESDLQPTTSLATFRPLAGNVRLFSVRRQFKAEWNQRKDSPVAQLVEQATVNRLVIGSSPIGGALVLNLSRHCPAFFTPLPRASMFFVYVLHSQSSGKRYIGQTADLDRRLKEHNDPSHNLAKYNSRNAAPWILLHREQNETRAAAMSQEKWLKSGVGREWPHAQFDRTGPPLNHGLTQRRKAAKNSTHRTLIPSFAS